MDLIVSPGHDGESGDGRRLAVLTSEHTTNKKTKGLFSHVKVLMLCGRIPF